MTFTITTIIIGVALLISIAVAVGSANARAERAAWSRIARQRRELFDWEQDLINAAEARECTACRLLRRRYEDDR
jgi:hypothetical protein